MRPTQPFKSMRVAPAAIAITSLVTVAASKSSLRAGESRPSVEIAQQTSARSGELAPPPTPQRRSVMARRMGASGARLST
jgi:hypothetical protein